MMSENRLRVERVATPEGFGELQSCWAALAPGLNNIFMTHEWLQTWWEFFREGKELWVLVVKDGDRVVAVMPLMRERGVAGLRRLAFVGSGEVTPNHLDVLAPDDALEGAVSALAGYLVEASGEWDLLELNKLPQNRPTAGRFRAAFERLGLRTKVEVSAVCKGALFPDSFQGYLMERTSHVRKGLRASAKQLAAEHPSVRVQCAQTIEEAHVALEALSRLHQARWTGRGYPGTFAKGRVMEFHRAFLPRAAAQGYLRSYVMTDGQQVAGVEYCFRVGDTLQTYSTGFDPSFSRFRPGIQLLCHAIEHAILEGAQRLDMLEGDEPYKQYWAPRTCENTLLSVYAPHWRGAVTHLGDRAFSAGFRFATTRVPERVRRPLWKAFLRARARIGGAHARESGEES